MSIEQHSLTTSRGTLPYLFRKAAGAAEAKPLVVFLHGAKDRGNDLSQLLAWGFPKFAADSAALPYHFLALQIPPETTWPEWQAELFVLIDSLSSQYDADRVVLSGFSLGSAGTWQLGSEHAQRFAGLVIVSGRVPETLGNKGFASLQRTPVWVFHGGKDERAPLAGAEAAVEALRALRAPVQFTLIAEGDHFIADEAYGNSALHDWIVSLPTVQTAATV